MSRLIGLACLLAACGGADQSSPRGVAEHYVAAMDGGDVDKALAVIVPRDKLQEAFDCGAGDALGRALQRAREDLRPNFEGLGRTGMRIRLGAFAAESRTLTIGDTWRDCTARMALEVQRAQVTLAFRKGGRDDEESERWDFVRFTADGPWWLVPR